MKKTAMVVSAAVLLVFLVYQGSMAFFHAQTEVGAKISAGKLGIDIIKTDDTEKSRRTEDGFLFEKVMPGADIESKAHIENVEDMPLYVRLTATKYWTDAQGKKIPDADASLISLDTEGAERWIVIDDSENSNHEIVYFYYTKPLDPKEKTSDFLKGLHISSALSDQTYSDYQIHLDLEAEAVQSKDGAEAALAEWGMDIVTDANGTILSIEE